MVKKRMRNNMAIILAIIMIINMLPLEHLTVHAFDVAKYKVDTVTIFKIYDKDRNIIQRRVLITGAYLKDADVGIFTSEGYKRLTKRTDNTEGLLQFDIDNDQLGNYLWIEGKEILLNEDEMPTLTGANRRVEQGIGNLVLQGTKLKNIRDISYINAGYEYKGAYTPIEKSWFDNPSEVTIEKPTGSLGMQNIIFEKINTIPNVNFNSENPSVDVKVNIKYTYKDQFRLYQNLDISDLKMYPNRGQKGDRVYIEAPAGKLDSYDVFFLKETNGTDPYTNKNKGQNKTFQQNIGNKDILTVTVPDIIEGEYYVMLTNAIPSDKDPMLEVTQEQVLEEKYTVINANIKSRIISINPKSGPDTGTKATISSQFTGTLNIPEFVPNTDGKIYSFGEGNRELVVDYVYGTYKNSIEKTYSAIRKIKIIIGSEAAFIKKPDNKPDVSFTKDLDIINIITAQITDADINPVKDVIIQTETTIRDPFGNIVQTVTERAVMTKGYTYFPSKIEPVVDGITPDKVQVTKTDENKYQIPKPKKLMAIYGKNFMIHKYTDSSGNDIVRYPIIELGSEIKLNPNPIDPDFKPGLDMKVLNSLGQELDGSTGNEIGTKILFYLPDDLAPISNIGKTFIKVTNPIRNSAAPGLTGIKVDGLEFVLVEENKNPIISDVNPDTVAVEGGVEVKITGNNFMSAVRLFLDGEEIKNIKRAEDGKEIIFTAPKGREGTTQLMVMNPEGGAATWYFSYVKTYTNPKLFDFAPKSGNTGTLVVVKGDNFIPPDPTDKTDLRHRLIGTRILLGGIDINDYELDSNKRIVLKPFLDPSDNPVINMVTEGSLTSIKVAEYYPSIIFADVDNNYYTIGIDGAGRITLSDGVYNTYTIKLSGGQIKADKKDGSIYDLSSDKEGIIISDGAAPILSLKMLTPYKTDADGKIIGNRAKVVDKNTIYFTVPALPADGYYDVTVLNPDTKRDQKTGTNGFYYFAHPQSKPKIHKIIPNEGTTDGGYAIDIEGEDFMDIGIDKSKVFINGIQVPANDIIVSPNGKLITIKRVPKYPGDLFKDKGTNRYAVPVVVVNPDGGSVSQEGGFTYLVPTSHPKLVKIVPAKGTAAGGEVVEITGTDFRFFEPYDDTNRNGERDDDEPYTDINGDGVWNSEADYGAWIQPIPFNHPKFSEYFDSPILPKVFFGDNKAKIVEFSRGYIKVITPEGNAGKVDVYIVNNDAGTSDKLGYTYEASSPKITRIFPKSGKMQGGDTIEFLGSGFDKTNMDIYNGAEDANGSFLYDRVEMAAVRFGSLTNRNIARELDNSGRIDNKRTTVKFETNKMMFEYDASGSSTKLTMSKTVDDKLYKTVIKGYDDGVKYIPLSLMRTTTGEAFPGKGLVRAEVGDGRLLIDTGYSQNVRYVDSTQLFVMIPTHHTIGNNIPAELINPDKGKAAIGFEYMNPYDYPVISRVEPINKVLKKSTGLITDYDNKPTADDQEYYTYVSVTGGVLLTINGSNFKRTAKVYLDDKELQILDRSTNGDRLLVVIPPSDLSQAGLKKPITVDNGDGGITGTREPNDYYKMLAPYFVVYQKGLSGPKIDSVIPDKTTSRGQNIITVIGMDFRPNLKVFIGGVAAEVIELQGTERIRVKVPLGLMPGKTSVMVQNADYGADEKKDALTIISSPEIQDILDEQGTTLSPRTLDMTGGENIIIKGIEFQDGAQVIFGGKLKYMTELAQGETGIPGINIKDEEVYVVGGTAGTVSKVEDGILIHVTTPALPEGDIYIIVINKDGGISEPQSIKIIRPLPGKPTSVRAEAVDGDTVKLEWEGTAQLYQIFASFGDKSSAKELSDFNYVITAQPERLDSGRLRYYIKGLMTETYYIFRVVSVNDFGVSQEYGQSNKVKTPDTIRSEAKYNDEYITPGARTDWTQSTRDNFIYNIGEKSLKEGPQLYQIDFRTKKVEPNANRMVKIPVALVQNYNKTYRIWDKAVSMKFDTTALRADEILSITNNKNDAAAILEIYSPKGQRYDEIISLLNRRSTIVKALGIGFNLQKGDKTQGINKFKGPVEASITLDPKYTNSKNLELYYYNIPSNKLEKLNFTKNPSEAIITTPITTPGEYVITVK